MCFHASLLFWFEVGVSWNPGGIWQGEWYWIKSSLGPFGPLSLGVEKNEKLVNKDKEEASWAVYQWVVGLPLDVGSPRVLQVQGSGQAAFTRQTGGVETAGSN